jgi:endonuclease III
LNRLEKFYGPQEPSFPVDPYEFLVWWYCGYPASDAACTKGWNCLTRDVGIDPGKLLKAKPAILAAAIKPGGMFPALRAQRLQELAFRVENEFGGDLRAALAGPVPKARKLLKSFHGIADPGADRILLFARMSPIAAVPSNCAGVLLRIRKNATSKNYSVTYREEQRVIQVAWVALIGYIYGDAKRRQMRYVMWTLLSIFIPNAIGMILYFILRDPLPKPCPGCGHVEKAKFPFCPHCGTLLQPTCQKCDKPVEPTWANCAYCGQQLPEPATRATQNPSVAT